MENVREFLIRASDKSGLKRDKYTEHNITENFSNIMVNVIYGNLLNEIIISSFLHREIFTKEYKNKYKIIVTLPGRSFLYPCADEVWSPKNENDFILMSKESPERIFQSLNKYIHDVHDIDFFSKYFKNGYTKLFSNQFEKNIELPPISSLKSENMQKFSKYEGRKCFIMPFKHLNYYGHKEELEYIDIECYKKIINSMLSYDITPIVVYNKTCYDLSPYFYDKCLFFMEERLDNIVSIARSSGFVFDLFTNNFIIAFLARVPFFSCIDRRRFVNLNLGELFLSLNQAADVQYKLDFNMVKTINRSFNFQAVAERINYFHSDLKIPSSSHTITKIDQSLIKKARIKKFGLNFFKIESILE